MSVTWQVTTRKEQREAIRKFTPYNFQKGRITTSVRRFPHVMHNNRVQQAP